MALRFSSCTPVAVYGARVSFSTLLTSMPLMPSHRSSPLSAVAISRTPVTPVMFRPVTLIGSSEPFGRSNVASGTSVQFSPSVVVCSLEW